MTLPAPVAVGDPVAAAGIDQLIAAGSVAVSGTVVITPTGAGVTTGAAVTFPVGRFGSTPNVFVTAQTSTPDVVYIGVTSVTAAGMTVNLNRTTVTATTIFWLAIDTP